MISALLALKVASFFSPITVQVSNYHGWPGCFRMTNGSVELVYVPQVGRIMRYALVGGPNMLWENVQLAGKTSVSVKPAEWANYGGDKLWPAPQSLWNWPPDPILDGHPYRAAIEGNSLVINGESSAKSGVRFSRRITMDANGTAIHLENKMTSTASTGQELAIWEIVQTDNPDRVIVPVEVTPEMPLGWAPYDAKTFEPAFATVHDGALSVVRNPKAGFKVGSASPKGVLRALKGKFSFNISARKTPGKYVDGGKFLAVYANGDPDKYMELEVTGPLTLLAPGQSTVLTTTWSIAAD